MTEAAELPGSLPLNNAINTSDVADYSPYSTTVYSIERKITMLVNAR